MIFSMRNPLMRSIDLLMRSIHLITIKFYYSIYLRLIDKGGTVVYLLKREENKELDDIIK